jgi:hypothetical protein
MSKSMYQPRRKPLSQADPRWDHQTRLLLWLASCVSVISFLFYFKNGDVLLYGDAVAHINIARRVFDSRTPGLLQLGTVWLPLPHLLMMPFLVSNDLWRRGAGGSIPSLIAYVLGVVGMFRLVRGSLVSEGESPLAAPFAGWISAFVYAANPNLIYMQTTAMGETLYLAFFVWAVLYFSETLRGDRKALTKCGLCLLAACLTRYDGWFLATAIIATVLVLKFTAGQKTDDAKSRLAWQRRAIAKFVVLAAAGPALWLAYNGIIYRNPLEFENGPYSAKAIERKTQNSGEPGHPGTGHPLVAGMYFVKAAEANVANNPWVQRLWLLFGVSGIIVAAVTACKKRLSDSGSGGKVRFSLLFLLIPLPFYSLSVAFGGVPIFVPKFWPFSYYNVRYGLQLLPAFAACFGVLAYWAARSKQWNEKWRGAIILAVMALVGAGYASVWNAGPVCLEEAKINMRGRNLLETQLAGWLEKLPTDATLLMYLGDHVGAVQQAGIPLRHVINEGNHRVWKQPYDPNGLWERALANPAKYADYVVAFEGGPVWQAAQKDHLKEIVEIHMTGQPRAFIYSTR